jgi:cell division septation protein DedD
MAQTDGEKELVLGNKQLIGLFFVVVALCGVFFAMGYMMGRPSRSDVAPAEAPASAGTAAQSQAPEPPRETPDDRTQPSSANLEASRTSEDAGNGIDRGRPVETHAAQDTVPTVVPASTGSTSVAVPQAGAIYLQVTALRRSDADSLVRTLREQSFPVLLADSSKPDLYRVLVGPYQQAADVSDAKAKLKALGFGNAFVQK